ncbi:MAG: enoyl-CoA hydratase/isomerase family protein [Proteobacteria bacterium]|nr:enoyl-CoA hydratase/isomerase family protein [Pseudomonadota bacterium]
MFETLLYEVTDGVALITLNRPEHHNAVNSVMSRELPDVWSRVNSDPTAAVAIISGAGDRAFCSGADMGDLPALDGDSAAATIESLRWTSLQNHIWKPVICAVNGMTVGGGLHFVADSDIVIASESASFFDTHVKVGLVAGLEAVGLCRRLLLRARQVADMIKRNSPTAMARTKQAIWQAADMGLAAGLQNAWQLMMDHNLTHPDIAEGRAAFLEKRPPRWMPFVER